MRIAIIGGTGFLGSALRKRLESNGHVVSLIPARALLRRDDNSSPDSSSEKEFSVLHSAFSIHEVVVNLAGASIGDKRWSAKRKKELVDSRVLTTRAIVDVIATCNKPPKLVSINAVGYYGNTTTPSNEGMGAGVGFLAQLAQKWEAEAMRAQKYTHVVILRTAIVLDAKQGALPPMMLPFKLFVGGPFGSGNQYIPWVHREDAISALEWACTDEGASGPYNVAAPQTVTVKQFAKALGKALHRPWFFHVPSIVLWLVLGRRSEMLMDGQNVVPQRLMGTSFKFEFPTLEDALADLL